MAELENPALKALLQQFGAERVFGQVLVRRSPGGFDLCHVADRSAEGLAPLPLEQLRRKVQFTALGAFRPIKSAPNLAGGWKVTVSSERALGAALDILYPGALADWFAVQTGRAEGIAFRAFTDRQTGMYRITGLLSDEQAARAAQACCGASFCLKRRLWHGPGFAPDEPETKSDLPCLEPCPVMLEFARKAMRIEQEEPLSLRIAPSDLATIKAGLEWLARSVPAREGDVAAPNNPRRAVLALAKLDGLPEAAVDGHG